MFSKAKIKRFNEEVGCAPPPTKYNTKIDSKTVGGYIEKSKRWDSTKGGAPSPTAYHPEVFSSPLPKSRPSSASFSSRLNTSTVSTGSGSFIFPSPPQGRLSRSKSARSFNYKPKNPIESSKEIESELNKVISERDELKERVRKLEEQIFSLTNSSDKSVTSETVSSTTKDSFVQVDLSIGNETVNNDKSVNCNALFELDIARERICSLEDENAQLVCKVNVLENTTIQSEESTQIQNEKLEHLTKLRDNLETSIAKKDDLIAELQLQFDQVVSECESQKLEVREWHDQLLNTRDQLRDLETEKEIAQNKVQSLVAMYEGMVTQHKREQEKNEEMISKKNIEIELLNESISSLSRRLYEHESLQEEAEQHRTKISSLEMTVSELSMVAKEKEVMETVMQDELKQRDNEVARLEHSIEEVETRMDEVLKDRDHLIDALEEEKAKTEELSDRIKDLERSLKEKEVVQQFLEKEVASREAELMESTLSVERLESDLETARQVALDLQQEAEAKLNELLSLKAEITVKDYDLDAKEETINTLKEEIMETTTVTSDLKSKLENSYISLEVHQKANNKISELEAKLSEVQEAHKVAEENTGQLEEKIVDLMSEISDRDSDYNNKMRELESELEELSVKYSDSLLEHEATRRALSLVSEELHKERLLLEANEKDLDETREKFNELVSSHAATEKQLQDITDKCNEVQTVLGCVEEERNEFARELKKEQDIATVSSAAATLEIESLKASNNGFMSQITQLKIDIRKKSEAVNDMKVCIETLREEKSHLTSLRDNLENTLENKEHIIIKLKSDLEEVQSHNEEERNLHDDEKLALTSRIGDLENHAKEDQNSLDLLKTQLSSLEADKETCEAENEQIVKNYEEQILEFKNQQSKLTIILDDLKTQRSDCQDQINNLQVALEEKTLEADLLKEQYTEAQKALESKQDRLNSLSEQLTELKQETDTLSKSLDNKDSIVTSLNATLAGKSDEIKGLYKSLEEKQSSLVALEERVQYLEETEDQLAAERDDAAQQLCSLRDTLNITKEKLNRLETSQREETAAELSRCTLEYESELSLLKDKNTSLSDEVNKWKTKFDQLEKMIEPFREQLDSYESERLGLLSSSSAAKDEIAKLSSQYAKLLGHSNHKQKIHHVIKLKTENNQFKDEIQNLRLEVDRQRKAVRRLEAKLEKQGNKTKLNDTSKILGDKENNARLNDTKLTFDKENISLLVNSHEPLSCSTPARATKKTPRL